VSRAISSIITLFKMPHFPEKDTNRSKTLKKSRMTLPGSTTEHVLDGILVSPDLFIDCAQALIHTILFHRSIDVPVEPQSISVPGAGVSYASAESPESAERILSRLVPLQELVFTGAPRTWVILSISYNVPKKGWFRDSYANEVWERWCIPFTFDTRTVQEMRVAMLHTISQITMKANGAAVPSLPEGGQFAYTMNLPTDKDWETSREFIRLVKRIVNTPATMFY
jgi:hypothetical protein